MTDALACWFLARYEEGGQPWAVLEAGGGLAGQEGFAGWVANERLQHRMRNDDVTMLRLRLK